MDFKSCSQCGKEIEGTGILFRDRTFCGDECCDEFEEELSAKDAPSLEDLEGEAGDQPAGGKDDLGYRDDKDQEDNFDDDDYSVNEGDF